MQVFEHARHMLEEWKLAQEMRKTADVLATNITAGPSITNNV